MQISGVDPRVTEYIARSLLLASGYLREAGEFELAAVREGQARAIAAEYGFELPASPEDLALLMDEVDAELAQAAEPSWPPWGSRVLPSWRIRLSRRRTGSGNNSNGALVFARLINETVKKALKEDSQTFSLFHSV